MNKPAPIFDIQSFALHDGPGIRTIVFFKGCPLRCTWCCNPEGQSVRFQLRRYQSKCVSCGNCLKVCVKGAVSYNARNAERGDIRFNNAVCDRCEEKLCVENCAGGALNVAGSYITIDELYEQIKKDIRLYWNSGGGVTFSGGEPLLYAEFIAKLSVKLKSVGINTAVETCGYWDWDPAWQALELCDVIFFDIKSLDDEVHKQYTGVSHKNILFNLEKLAKLCSNKVTVSIPIIPHLIDSCNKLEETLRYIKLLNINKARILSYHRMGISKYDYLGIPYKHNDNDNDNEEIISQKLLQDMEKLLESFNKNNF